MKIAVIGSGVSGLAATWLLNEHSDHEVHLYEADDRPGGHANTVRFRPRDQLQGDGVDVDTGFIVFNPPTYPNFLRFLELYPPYEDQPLKSSSPLLLDPALAPNKGIRILQTEMSFSVSRDAGTFEWAGKKDPLAFFCQRARVFDPNMWRMLYDVLRFNTCAPQIITKNDHAEISIGQYLDQEGYSDAFRDNYLMPMAAAVWSTPPDKCFDEFPAHTLIKFMYNHSLLQMVGKPKWMTICGGSHHYVNQILQRLPESQLHLSSKINCVSSVPSKNSGPTLELVTDNDEKYLYDHVIFACHSDDALRILQAGDGFEEDEARILESFEWNKNEVLLHSDTRLMPRSRRAWSSWNFLAFSEGSHKANIDRVSLTYGMNDLQHIPEDKYGPVLATLNPPPHIQVDEDKIQGRWSYDHPVIDDKAVKAQQEMYKIQNKRSISYAGAYLKYGFHEDGFTSGLLAACSVEDKDLYERVHKQFSSDSGVVENGNRVIHTKNATVRPPFAIEHADHHLFFRQSVMDKVFAGMFRVLEASGSRKVIGAFGSLTLTVCGFLVIWPASLFLRMIGRNVYGNDKKRI
ncbi:hypothetical protein AGABI2DRAFT_203560 [Agaricus bisporus var. bisporus H97]|uniref:hypothetical protein n=1 Tax=Agaricus bisporus var. bisporus (strain H97 / ATCC MYA-4626 / FGSC 10389) TaxID=936046 RepID=UPI00029F72CB|nr:hypothetical protein AGABI2DRAFT_203560 [Agaricus bisporus var. bisporus H97]EKV48629.1 hypothetical protein AGABI2DRAFT_203560 [Agaricus bisporus var. bisporus H97]